jgi:murein DD-endopeptidase MepM/ murein hydrolase activator NlpD
VASDENGPIPKESISTPRGALTWALKQTSAYNIFDQKSLFRAEVITPPHMISPEEAANSGGTGTSTSAIGQYQCFARILDPKMAHMKFLPEPCRIAATSNPALANQLNALHTKVVISHIDAPVMPHVNDIVEISLEPGDNGDPYDLQTATFIKVFSRPRPPELPGVACSTLADLFEGAAAAAGPETGGYERMDDVIFPEADAEFENPAIQGDYKVTSLFTPPGVNCRVIQGICKKHSGMDLAAPRGAPILSIGDGTVTDTNWGKRCNQRLKSDGTADYNIYVPGTATYTAASGCGGGGGNRIRIKHAAGQLADHDVWTVYMHLDNMTPLFKVGDSVKKGQVIGYVGNSGGSAGFHLHIEAHLSSDWKIKADPLTYMKLVPGSSTSAIASAGVDSGNQRDGDTEEAATG